MWKLWNRQCQAEQTDRRRYGAAAAAAGGSCPTILRLAGGSFDKAEQAEAPAAQHADARLR